MAEYDQDVNIPAKAMFVWPSAIPKLELRPKNKYIDIGYELCDAMKQVRNVSPNDINGCTKINGLWRLCLKGDRSQIARASILANGLSLNGHMVPVMGESPRLIDGRETSRLTITNLPLSISNEAVKCALIDLGLRFGNSEIQWEMYRDFDRNMSNFKNGRRYINIAPPSEPIPKKVKVAGMFDAFLDYKGPLPESDILQKEQNKRRNHPEYTSDSDSESDLNDNDAARKGLIPRNSASDSNTLVVDRDPTPALHQNTEEGEPKEDQEKNIQATVAAEDETNTLPRDLNLKQYSPSVIRGRAATRLAKEKKDRSSSKRRNSGDSQPKPEGKKQKKREKKNNNKVGKADKQGVQSENPDSSPSVALPIQQANNITSNIIETLAGVQEDTYL